MKKNYLSILFLLITSYCFPQYTCVSSIPPDDWGIELNLARMTALSLTAPLCGLETSPVLVWDVTGSISPTKPLRDYLSGGTGINYNTTTGAISLNPTYARGLISLTTTGSGAATYNSSTGVLNVPTPVSSVFPVPTALASGARTFNTAYQISATRPSEISVSSSVAVTIGVLGSVKGQAILEISPNGTTGWIYIGEVQNVSSTIGLSTTNGGAISTQMPAGYYWRLRTVNTVTGLNNNPVYTFLGGNEKIY